VYITPFVKEFDELPFSQHAVFNAGRVMKRNGTDGSCKLMGN